MQWWEWGSWGLAMIAGVAGILFGWAGFAKARATEDLARRNDSRLERVEQLSRVDFHIERVPKHTDIYALVNHGTDVAFGLEIDLKSVVGFRFVGNHNVPVSPPHIRNLFQLSGASVGSAPDVVRVTWREPFAGEQYVPMPLDPEVQIPLIIRES